MKKASQQRVHTAWVHLYKILENANQSTSPVTGNVLVVGRGPEAM